MTPEEFTARAGAAVQTVEPDPASYDWLTRNVARRARRRRVVWAATAAVALAGVAVAVVPGDEARPPGVTATASASASATVSPSPSPSPTPSATPTSSASPSPTASGSEAARPGSERSADVDGNGTPDTVTIVEEGSRSEPASWHWGIRVAFSESESETIWDPCCTNEGQQLGPFWDLDGDGRAELSASPGGTAYSADWYLVTYRNDTLMRVSGPRLVTGVENGREVSWGCAERGGLVQTSAVADGTTGTRVYYRLDGTRLVETSRVNDQWGNGVPRPREYDEAFDC